MKKITAAFFFFESKDSVPGGTRGLLLEKTLGSHCVPDVMQYSVERGRAAKELCRSMVHATDSAERLRVAGVHVQCKQQIALKNSKPSTGR